jgi:hypothetical protein
MRRGEAEKQPQSIKFSHAIRRRNKKNNNERIKNKNKTKAKTKRNETRCKQMQSDSKEVKLQSAVRTTHQNSSKQIKRANQCHNATKQVKQETIISNDKPIMQIMQSRNMSNRIYNG